MQTVILVIHILASIALTAAVLLQRSEGGALGIGGGGGGAGLMSGRGATGTIVRTTMIIAGIFFVTSLVLTNMANRQAGDQRSDVERALGDDSETGSPAQEVLDLGTPLIEDPLSEGEADLPAPPEGDPLAEDTAEPAAPQ